MMRTVQFVVECLIYSHFRLIGSLLSKDMVFPIVPPAGLSTVPWIVPLRHTPDHSCRLLWSPRFCIEN